MASRRPHSHVHLPIRPLSGGLLGSSLGRIDYGRLDAWFCKSIIYFSERSKAAFPARSTTEKSLRRWIRTDQWNVQQKWGRAYRIHRLSIYSRPSFVLLITLDASNLRYPIWLDSMLVSHYLIPNQSILGSPTHPTDIDNWPTDWTPIPIHTVPQDEDRVRI